MKNTTPNVGTAWPEFLLRANSTVMVITFSTQNCAQAGSQSTRPLPHMNLNVSESVFSIQYSVIVQPW